MGCLQHWKQVLGVLAVSLTASVWVGGSFVVQAVSKGGSSSNKATLPSFVTNYFTLAVFALYFPIFLGQASASRSTRAQPAQQQEEPSKWNDGLESKTPMAPTDDDMEAVAGLDDAAGGSKIGTSPALPAAACLHCGHTMEHSSKPAERMNSWELFIASASDDEEEADEQDDAIPGATITNFLAALLQPLLEGMAVRKILISALMMYPVWFMAYYLFVIALMFTSATSAQVMYTTMSVFSYLLSIFMLGEKFIWGKAISTALCVIGAVLVNLADIINAKGDIMAVVGNILAMAAAFTYALYSIWFQKVFPHGIEGPSMCLYFSILGGLQCIVMLPGVTWYAALGQITLLGCAAIIGRGIANMIAEYMWAMSVLLLGPSLSSTLVVPLMVILGALGDFILGHATWLHHTRSIIFMAVGMATIFIGFLGLSFSLSTTDRGVGEQPSDCNGAAKAQLRGGMSVSASMIVPARFVSSVWLVKDAPSVTTPRATDVRAPSLRLASMAAPRLNRSLTSNTARASDGSGSLRRRSAFGTRPKSLIVGASQTRHGGDRSDHGPLPGPPRPPGARSKTSSMQPRRSDSCASGARTSCDYSAHASFQMSKADYSHVVGGVRTSFQLDVTGHSNGGVHNVHQSGEAPNSSCPENTL